MRASIPGASAVSGGGGSPLPDFPEQERRRGRPAHPRLPLLERVELALILHTWGKSRRCTAKYLRTSAATLTNVLSGSAGPNEELAHRLRLFVSDAWVERLGGDEPREAETKVSVDWVTFVARCSPDRLGSFAAGLPPRASRASSPSQVRVVADMVGLVICTSAWELQPRKSRKLPYRRILDVFHDDHLVAVIAFERTGYCVAHRYVHDHPRCTTPKGCSVASHFHPRAKLTGVCSACEAVRSAPAADVMLQITGLGCRMGLTGVLRSLFLDVVAMPGSIVCRELHVAVDVRSRPERWLVTPADPRVRRQQHANGATYGTGRVNMAQYDKRRRHDALRIDAPLQTMLAPGTEAWPDITRFEFRTRRRSSGGVEDALAELIAHADRYVVVDGATLARPCALLGLFSSKGTRAGEAELRSAGLSNEVVAWVRGYIASVATPAVFSKAIGLARTALVDALAPAVPRTTEITHVEAVPERCIGFRKKFAEDHDAVAFEEWCNRDKPQRDEFEVEWED